MFLALKVWLGATIGELLDSEPLLGAELIAELEKRDVPRDPELVLGDIPMVRQLIEEARLDKVLALSEIGEVARNKIKPFKSPEAITHEVLQQLVDDADISAADATAVGKTIERYFVCEDSEELVTAVNTISGGGANFVLSIRTPAGWETALAGAGAVIPPGTTLTAVSEVLARRFEALYPACAVLARIPPVIESTQKGALDALIVLEAANPRRFDGTFDDLDTSGVSSGSLPALRLHWEKLRTMVRGYPGLDLATLFDNYAQSTGQRYDAMNARINAFIAAISSAAGPSFRADAFALDLREGSEDWARFNLTTSVSQIKAAVRAFQRMRVVGGNLDIAATLLAAGYASAAAVAGTRLDVIQALPGLAGSRGEQVWGNARKLASDAALFVAGVADAVGGAFDPAPTQAPPSVGQGLASLDGFASLFGSQSYCDCDHCASILGPAAYFVDLMHFVKQEVGGLVPDSDVESLKSRRPDLWTFPLTCEATTALVPTLEIVNEVLENAVATAAGYTGDFGDRAAVEGEVYLSANGLPGNTRSFAQPFSVGLAHAAALLDGFEVNRAALADALGVTAARRVLGISVAAEQLITVPRTTEGSLAEVYGIAFTTPIADLDAEILAPAMGLDREGLGSVVSSWFVRQGTTDPHIELGRRSAESIQDDIERVKGLTVASLDRMHRLTRASRALGLSVSQLDRLLQVTGDDELTALAWFAQLRALAARVGATIGDDDAAALAGLLDASGLARFNRGVRGPSQAWPSAAAFYHPGLVTDVAPEARGAAARLASALGLKDPELLALIRFLSPHLAQGAAPGFDPAGDPAQRYFVLSAANLTLLDRHARLARLLGLSIVELATLMPLAGLTVVSSVADALTVAKARDAWRGSGRTFDELVAATGGDPSRADTLLDVSTAAVTIRQRYLAARVVPDDLFAAVYGISVGDSLRIFDANPGLFSTVGGARVLADAVDLRSAVIAVPPGIVVTVDGMSRPLAAGHVVLALMPHSAQAQLTSGLATAAKRDVAEMELIATLAGVTIDATLVASIRDVVTGTALETAIAAASRVEVATRGWTQNGLTMLADSPARFGAGSWPAIDPVHPERPTFTFAQATALGRAGVRGTATDRQDVFLQAAFHFTVGPPAFAADADAPLAALLGTSEATVASIRGRVSLAASVTVALDQLAVLVRLADRLGVDGDALRDLVSDDDGARAIAAAAVERAAELRGENDTSEAQRLATAQNQVREVKRDALIDYLTHDVVRSGSIVAPVARTPLALSKRYLLDVEAGGCATTSRVVAATNAVQEYVTYITLGLEADHTGTRVTLSDAGTRSWEWRRAYRVWEANRKVFLWPENYLEPSVRDDKTPLFTALEEALGQSDLDEASILKAYATYIQGLEDLASLRVAGAYHDIGAGTDVLHLIGVTPSEPAKFYYRSVTDLSASLAADGKVVRWGQWEPIELSIPERLVAPFVFEGRLRMLWSSAKTRPLQKLQGGNMAFTGYQHSLRLSMSELQSDGRWSSARDVPIPWPTHLHLFGPAPGQVPDVINNDKPWYEFTDTVHLAPVDGYGVRGASWSVWPTVSARGVALRFRNFTGHGQLDASKGQLSGAEESDWVAPRPLIGVKGGQIYVGTPGSWHMSSTAFTNLVIHHERIAWMCRDLTADETHDIETLTDPIYNRVVATATSPVEALAVAGAPGSALFDFHGEVLVLQPGGVDGRHVLRRMGTTATRTLGETLMREGIDGVLATSRQMAMAEAAVPMTIDTTAVSDRSGAGQLDYRGPSGTHLRELFLHIPMLIATALAGRGRHADARRWFHRVFDPTSTEVIDTSMMPPEEAAHRQLERVWRYREFREQDAASAVAMLSDGAALAAYRESPFNPHAIARCRLSAYQRHAFGRYVDNLLDWGDLLFAQFERETVEEARVLYQLAARLLGVRPARLGECRLDVPEPRDYEHIEPLLTSADPPRIGSETEVLAERRALPSPPHSYLIPTMAPVQRLTLARAGVPWTQPPVVRKPSSFNREWLVGQPGPRAPSKALGATDLVRGPGAGTSGAVGSALRGAVDDTLASSVLNQLGPVFCVPVNKTLLARWDRVEDRLWKLHHCLDLNGVRRDLALFAPELDPMSRVEATALGLTPDELVSDTAAEVPPYRFSYLIERAKGFASSLAGFGSALLGALERRDSEALSIVRQEQGLMLARMTRQQREMDVDQARESLTTLTRQIQSAEYRRDYYDGLLSAGLSTGEEAELTLRTVATAMHVTAEHGHLTASVQRLIPTLNMPWSVSFGGENVAQAAEHVANWLSRRIMSLESVAGVMGLTAGHERRAEGWEHQLQLTKDELESMASQRRAAELRVKAAEQALATYDESVKQLEDVLAFERDRVTNLGLHTRLSAGLTQLYRLAYGHALALARLAERAYRYERGDGTGGLTSGYWDASLGGLLAGERLLSDLQALDRRFLETNHRELEIDQPFPLSQIDPRALVTLRETGTCTFDVPEAAFDLAYPGHYRRRLRAVRLTIPCVTGPYVNVSATLTLTGSEVRATPMGDLTAVPLAHGTTIAASSAQADGGVFELSFRDERYLPFEGQGAVSSWQLTLPSKVRAFDYASITDVVLSLAYSARLDESLRAEVDADVGTRSIIAYHEINATQRLVSARQDFGASLARLVRSEVGTPVTFTLTEGMLPPVYRGRDLEVGDGALLSGVSIRVAPGVDPSDLELAIDGVAVDDFALEPLVGGLYYATAAWPSNMPWAGEHSITITAAGAGLQLDDGVDPDKLLDVMLWIPVRLA